MKRQVLVIAAIVLTSSVQALAQGRPASLRSQNANAPARTNAVADRAEAAPMPAPIPGVPRVLLGTIETTTTSREKILRYPRLIPMELGWEVKGFSFTFTAGDQTWGPMAVKGAVFTEEIKDKIKDSEAPRVKITIDNIKLENGGKEATANPIVVEYDH